MDKLSAVDSTFQNTLNRCFDDIERFVARIQSAAIAQRELEAQAHRHRTTHRKRIAHAPMDPQSGILQMRAQLPAEFEFVDILQKFKLSFNLLVSFPLCFSWKKNFTAGFEHNYKCFH